MVGCSVLGCKSRSERKLHEITFHLFPSNPDIKIKWLEATGRKNWHPTKFSRICSLHFHGASFVYRGKKVQLKPYSVPEKCVNKTSERRKLYKCDKCIRTYTNNNALENHKRVMHSIVNNTPPMKSCGNKNKAATDKFERYQCPVCKAIFPSKFVATKHIEVYHSKQLTAIHPVKLQDCPHCKQKNRNLALHKCNCEIQKNKIGVGHDATTEKQGKSKEEHYYCYLCSKVFNNINKFTVHVEYQHSKSVETMFFPNMTQFTLWKDHIEKLAFIQYRLWSEEINGRQFYHCINTKITDVFTERCPSIIVVQSYSKGILARLYKTHANHKTCEYNLAKEFRKYRITDFLQSIDNSNGYDQYLDFKTLLENILEAAAKIKISGLKELVEKALEMTIILNRYDDDDNPIKPNHVPTKSLTDAEITEVLKQEAKVTIKRENLELDISEPLKKKAHMVDVSPKIVNTFSLAEYPVGQQSDTDSCDDIDNKILISNYVGKQKFKSCNTKIDLLDDKDTEFSSFNDTYRDFVRKNLSLSKPMVTRSRRSHTTIKTNCSQKNNITMSSVADVTDTISKTSKKSTANSKVNTVSSVNINNSGSSMNNVADSPVNPHNISTTENVHSSLAPIVTPAPNHLMNNNMVFVAVPYAPVNTMIPTTSTNPFFNLVGVSIPEHITVTQTLSNNINKSNLKEEASPLTHDNTNKNEKDNSEVKSTETDDKVNTDVDSSDSDVGNDTEASKADDFKPKIKQKPSVKLETVKNNTRTPKKIDYEYEVIEQDSDCNILVLKL
ncbi:uncharacterized protein LOC110997796 isoform X2 [Pieris rapae]|uniref:uncharacterized protein LOC110997796 isoform X2 n=1 Tax=Pieris rapae TaxID=64459 RepID=UPI001E27CAA8|nr:uncharacterized protein LOC110997796 isoform X2 [Pieris rapae]XP_045489070.1 uncharacterized protein LOC110997796 isoform X2 [Pieris rapae]XP_045489071.1 uncharacterized protein LOC110997796 isoform X2 [Pieris rapae]